MKLTVLGSSSSGNCYLLEASDGILIIECGLPLIEVKKAIGFRLDRIAGAIVSHQHGDHAKFIGEYLNSAIRVCALQDVFDAHTLKQRVFCKSIEPMHGYKVGAFKVFVVPVVHDVPCVGFVIEHTEMGKMLFVTDTMMFEYRFDNLTHIMLEANYSDEILDYNIENGITPSSMRARLLQSHMEIKTTEKILMTSNLDAVQNIILIHLSNNNSDADAFKQRIMQKTGKTVTIARRGVCIDVSKDTLLNQRNMTKQKLFDVDDKVTVFDQTGVITEVIDQTQKPHLYTVMFDETGKTYTIEHYHIKPVRDTRPVTERIKTLGDAIKELGDEHEYVKTLRLYEEQMQGNFNDMGDIYAYMKLRIIVAALNEGWEPNFWDENEYKYWGWMYTLTEDEYNRLDEDEKKERTCRCVGRSNSSASAYGGLVYAYAYSASSVSVANYGSRLAFKSRELALYAVRQFKEIYAEYLF